MRFRVPQFIEIEDKIFGPLSFKQFIYVVGGGSIIVLFFLFLPNYLAFILAIPVGLLSAALAFYQINKRPFILTMEAAIKYLFRNKLYVWKKGNNQGRISESFLSVKKDSSDSKTLKEKTFALGLNTQTASSYETEKEEDTEKVINKDKK